MKGFIYKITNKVNGKVYVGQTRFTIEHRFNQHKRNHNIEHRKQPLYMAFAKYGIENFEVEELEQVDVEKLDEREKYWIAYYNSFKDGYNATIGGNGNIYLWTDSQYDEIRTLYLSGFSLKKVGELFGVSAYTITGILRSLGVKIRKNPMDINKVEADELINNYQNGYSLVSLAKQYNTDRETIKRFLISRGVNLKIHSLILSDKEAQDNVIKNYLDGMTYRDLEIKYHADTSTIKRILVMNGISLSAYRGLRRTVKGAFCLTDEQCLEAIKDYNDNKKVKDIAKKFEVNISTIYELFKRYHVKCNRYNHSKSVQSLEENKG